MAGKELLFVVMALLCSLFQLPIDFHLVFHVSTIAKVYLFSSGFLEAIKS